MKKLTLIVSAIALLIGFSQCKKEVITPNNNDNRIQITLNANYGGNGSKTTFDPATGNFTWLTGVTDAANEYVNVGGSVSGYLGQLSNQNHRGTGDFEGTITPPVSGETLYFFYLGNGNHAGATTVDFSGQDGTLANVTKCHIAIGSEEYTGQTSFSASLEMAMAIAYFNLEGFGSETVYLSGDEVYSVATIDYKAGTITGSNKGYLKAGTASSGMYVALIPSVNTETTINFISNSKNGSMTFLRGIQKGSYYSNSGNALEVAANEGGEVFPVFSVSSTKQVFFSKGNLQYQASTNTWRFAERQYDYVGDADYGNVRETIGGVANTKCNNANIANNYEGWIDLFGWGTGNNPTQTSTTATDYSTFTDWGTNYISNGDGYNWRTLTKDEWVYIINTRTTTTSGLITGDESSNARYVKATVNDVQGFIIFPDQYVQPGGVTVTCPSGKKPYYNGTGSSYTYFNVESGWNLMESAGAVFLPVSGRRSGTTVSNLDYGFYWSNYASGNAGYYLVFYSSNVNPQASYTSPGHDKSKGNAVRLVRE